MKLRLLLMGRILLALGAILLTARGFSAALAGVLAVGIVLLVVGLIWRQPQNSERIPTKDTHKVEVKFSNCTKRTRLNASKSPSL